MFGLAPEPAAISRRLIDTQPEFAHVRDAVIAWLWGPSPLRFRGGQAQAFIAVASVQGLLSDLFDELVSAHCGVTWPPLDFLVLVDAENWHGELLELGQERLVYHELCHVAQVTNKYGAPMFSKVDGRPKLKLVPHDTEVFDLEVARYGPAIVGLEAHLRALEAGHRVETRRAARETPSRRP